MSKWQYTQELNGALKTIQNFSSYRDAVNEMKRYEWDFSRYEHLGLQDDDMLITKLTSLDNPRNRFTRIHTYAEYKQGTAKA